MPRPNVVLDTNVLIRHWRRSRNGSLDDQSASDAEQWTRRLVEIQGTDAIVSPVAIEFVCGVNTHHEMTLARAYLGIFTIIDKGIVKEEDWSEARRMAERIPLDSAARDLGDRLIKAIANRLRHSVQTFDEGMPRTRSTKEKRTRPKSGKPKHK
jgi:predicted nucleic acid-binding protein